MEQRPSWEADGSSVKKFPASFEIEGSLPRSQEPATGPYFEQMNPVCVLSSYSNDQF
jgi:hypothetical protein